ncbi:MAG: metallophosphoesterase, partial [Patescibacteria group bacterium]|nr:metallophosphoesterase [Patescibacteria group bacterium]
QDQAVRGLIHRNKELYDTWLASKEKRRAMRILEGQAEASGVTLVNEDIIIITGEPGKRVDELQIDDILERRGLKPDEWQVKQVLDNQWEANAGRDKATGLPTKLTLFQYKIWLNRKMPLEIVYPAVVGPELPPPAEPDHYADDSEWPLLTVVVTDPQNPFRDDQLHQLFLRWLAHNKPAHGVIGGDILDNGYISQHRDDPAWHRTVQDCIQASFNMLYDYRQASLITKWFLIKGNHDDRIRNEQLERNERLYGVTAAEWPGEEPEEWVYSLNHLLHLKRLGVEYVEPKGTYEFQQVPLSPIIAVRHGHMTSKDASIKTAEQLGHSLVLGHTHRQSVIRKTRWNTIKREWSVLTAIEAGCMCQTEGGLGYANGGAPDWQPGFATVTTWPDGGFSFDLATYEHSGVLRWRDQVYSL